MKINTALILCAGFGKRLNPLTIQKPKPLLEVNDITLLENTINLIKNLNILNVKINSFHLKNQIKNFVSKKKFNLNIEIIEDGNVILDTGGGILNLIKESKEKNFIVFNPDTVWNLNYTKTIKEMQNFYFENQIQNLLMVVEKNKSFDKRFKGDFELKINQLSKEKINNYIFTGCQIINKDLFSSFKNTTFSISKIWDDLIKDNKLYGFESLNEFVHVTDLEIYNKLVKN
jgi:MurNAc alpha-1-phosphate uridylyltransferase